MLAWEQSRTSHPARVNERSASSFHLIPSHTWGPSRVMSFMGFRYFFTFVDDFLDVLGYI